MSALDPARRRELRAALLGRHPWIAHDDIGPRTVDAGECDRCGAEARMVTICGPSAWEGIGRRCASAVGTRAWCDGHAEQARTWLAVLAALPPEADAVARLWWVATGEVRLDPAAVGHLMHTALPTATPESSAPDDERTT